MEDSHTVPKLIGEEGDRRRLAASTFAVSLSIGLLHTLWKEVVYPRAYLQDYRETIHLYVVQTERPYAWVFGSLQDFFEKG